MRYRLLASYRGASYQAGVGPSDEEVTLFAACPPAEELGFRSSAGHWRKRVSVEEIDALWESRPVGRYRGERCLVLDDLGERLHIAYLGQDLYMARRLGFWEVDRGVFEVVVPRQEIDDLREERGEYELAVVEPLEEDPLDGDPSARDASARDPGHRDPGQPGWYAFDPPDTGPLALPSARRRDLMDRDLRSRELIDTGPRRVADPLARRDAGTGAERDASAQDPRDTGTWAAVRGMDFREPPEPGGPYPRGRGGWRVRDTDTGGWEAPDTGAWDARELADRAARETARATGDLADTGVWDAPKRADKDTWQVPERAGTGTSDALERAGTGTSDAPEGAGTGASEARDVACASGWDAREGAAAIRWESARWDQQDTVARDPVNAAEWEAHALARENSGPVPRPVPGWEPDEMSAPRQPQTPDAAAVWHGSPGPEDAGRWSPPGPVNIPATAPRLAIAGAAVPAPAEPAPGSLPAPGSRTVPEYAPRRESATRNEDAAVAGRSAGRRSADKARVTTQAIFSQLLELASIPESAYAVDDEVEGAMCLIHSRGGYEVFSLADQTRHEVRFFDDEEAAYFYLFGILAAEAVRSGHLGPKTPPGE